MQRVFDQLTLPAEHLALDEALLLAADEQCLPETIRIWEFDQPVVVIGRSSRVDAEIDRAFCNCKNIPVMRRSSGGAAVVAGPGCLMYTVVLRLQGPPALRKIDAAHGFVMERVLNALQQQLPAATWQGTCDLTWNNRKCSGNSLRIARHHLLYHGTMLYGFDLSLIARCLKTAPRQPEYRRQRDHASFVTNVPIDRHRFATDLCEVFGVAGQMTADSLLDRVRELRQQRYDADAWHFRH